jgi:hypothetical protein
MKFSLQWADPHRLMREWVRSLHLDLKQLMLME